MDYLIKKNIYELAKDIIHQTGDSSPLQGIKSCSGGNNQSWIVHTARKSYFLKHYFYSKEDKRDRFGVETSFTRIADSSGVSNIPGLLAVDKKNLLGLFQFIDGRELSKEEIDYDYIKQAVDFIRKINGKDKKNLRKQFVLYASDSCFSMAEHFASIELRLKALQNIDQIDIINLEANTFVVNVLAPEWAKLKRILKERIVNSGIDFHKRLYQEDMIISPSDFGFHNSILSKNKLFFIDFEYAGWDDPAKMVCDFFCQPAKPVKMDYYNDFLNDVSIIIYGRGKTNNLAQRITILFPLYRLKWCCIILNDFISAGRLRKQFAFGRKDRRQSQLAKAIRYSKIWL